MKAREKYVSPDSDIFFYTPSAAAKKTFFYPVCTGHFICEPGYCQRRSSYDSFMFMYIESGELTVEFENHTEYAVSGHFILLDCYKPHSYHTKTGCESLWLHFDGCLARDYYNMAVSHSGSIFSMQDTSSALNILRRIYDTFASGEPIREPLLSKQITDILTAALVDTPAQNTAASHSHTVEDILTYINERFAENLTIDVLAKRALLSPYHFIRIFKKETGFTPHEYMIQTRINAAKYLLKNTRLPVREICFRTGFSCESVFCTAFKRNCGIPPAEYRK